MPTELFRTVHGSHLYGLAHADSDRDLFVVTDSPARKVRHTIDGPLDVAEVGLSLFLDLAHTGSHQSVEALFSPVKAWTAAGARYRPMIERTRITGGAVASKYERTIRKFAHLDFKRRRHAVRLALNLAQLRAEGTIRPNLTEAAARR
ncbi:DNA polymerase beta superfamily protein [Leucobacter sp. HY1910]